MEYFQPDKQDESWESFVMRLVTMVSERANLIKKRDEIGAHIERCDRAISAITLVLLQWTDRSNPPKPDTSVDAGDE